MYLIFIVGDGVLCMWFDFEFKSFFKVLEFELFVVLLVKLLRLVLLVVDRFDVIVEVEVLLLFLELSFV